MKTVPARAASTTVFVQPPRVPCFVRAAFVMAALSWSASSGEAIAQDPAAQARASFQRGIEASDQGRYADAVREFEQSYQLRPSPVVLHNLGVAYRGVGRLLDALDAYNRYLASPGARATDEMLTRVRAEVDALRAEIPDVRFDVEPAAATVQIDGRSVEATQSPARLDPGRHVVTVAADDHVPFRTEFDLQRGEHRVVTARLTVAPADGQVAVDTNVASATVLLDGHTIGQQRVQIAASPGDHVVVLRAPGYRPVRRVVRVGRHGVSRVDVVLQRDGGLPAWAVVFTVAGAGVVAAGVAATVVYAATRDVSAPLVTPPNYWGEIPFPAR